MLAKSLGWLLSDNLALVHNGVLGPSYTPRLHATLRSLISRGCVIVQAGRSTEPSIKRQIETFL